MELTVFALGGAVVFIGICARLGAIRARVIFTRTPWQILCPQIHAKKRDKKHRQSNFKAKNKISFYANLAVFAF